MTTNPASQLLETGITLAILPGITAAIDAVVHGSPLLHVRSSNAMHLRAEEFHL